jgi:steroid delta-isomerase
MKRLVLAAAILPLCTPCRAEPAPVIHYAPTENLEHVDVALIDRADAAAQDTTVAQQQIREALESWRGAFNAGDASRVCDLFADDLISNYQGQPERNYESLCALLRRSLQDTERSFSYTSDIEEILVSGDLAVVRLIWTLQVTRRDGGDKHSGEEPGMDVFRLQPDGHWRIIRYLAYPAMP